MMVWFKPIYHSLGNLESKVLKQEILNKKIKQPIYVSGLARSGTTIMSQILSEHHDTANHCYSDFPEVFFPYWKNWLKKRQINFQPNLAERSHQDRLLVNNNSIEAFEEVLWMYYFNDIHKDGISHTLINEDLDLFFIYYQLHIKKLLAIHDKSRYLAKANYNINRIESILTYFPDAKFIIPVRHPINHIASLIKQHNLFKTNNNNKINKQLAASGHFEFGEIREVIDFGDLTINKNIINSWHDGDEIKGWAMYWQYIYGSVFKLKQKNKILKHAITFVKYEDLCMSSELSILKVLDECELNTSDNLKLVKKYTQQLTPPKYYTLPFSQTEKNAIMSLTDEVANYFSYQKDNHL